VNGTVLSHWPTTAATRCLPMALDEAHHGCSSDAACRHACWVLDTANGKMITSPEIPATRTTSSMIRPETGST
jgi:hypothetical protein